MDEHKEIIERLNYLDSVVKILIKLNIQQGIFNKQSIELDDRLNNNLKELRNEFRDR